MTLTVTILGCGSSGGVPRPGSGWGECNPANPRNRRRRCAVLIEKRGRNGVTTVLVDAGPDLREQLIDARVGHLDGVVLTHEHADHTHGIDDLRPIVLHMRRTVDVYMDEVTGAIMRERFRYIFESPPGSSYPPIAIARSIAADRSFTIDGPGGPIDVLPIGVTHGEIGALGLRIGDVAYLPDVSAIPPDMERHFQGLDVWIIDALRRRPHPSHFSVAEALEWIARAQPRHAVLTNLHTDLDYGTLAASVPNGVRVAYDGMTISLDHDGCTISA